jgi:hypothetical protein
VIPTLHLTRFIAIICTGVLVTKIISIWYMILNPYSRPILRFVRNVQCFFVIHRLHHFGNSLPNSILDRKNSLFVSKIELRRDFVR